MPNRLAKKCAISLQSFAKDCMACNGAISFSALGPVDCLPFAQARGLHRSVKKTPKVWGGGVLFFWNAGRSFLCRQR